MVSGCHGHRWFSLFVPFFVIFVTVVGENMITWISLLGHVFSAGFPSKSMWMWLGTCPDIASRSELSIRPVSRISPYVRDVFGMLMSGIVGRLHPLSAGEFSASFLYQQLEGLRGKVAKVSDGDTIKILDVKKDQ